MESWYRRKLDCYLTAMHESMLCHIRAAYKGGVEDIGFAQDARQTSPLLLRRAMAKWGKLWTRKFDKLSLDLSKKFADKSFTATQTAMSAAFRDAGFTVRFRPTRASIQSYQSVAAEQVSLIRSIPSQYLKDVQTSVWDSVRKGADMAQLSQDLQRNYGVSKKRAALIARDQNAKAKATIENTRRMELGIKEAIWMHSSAGKVPRPSHVAMNNKRFELAKGMWDSDEHEWVWPGQLINCRCTSKSVIPGLEDES